MSRLKQTSSFTFFSFKSHNCENKMYFDVPLISLANIFQNARLWEDALTVARMAVEIAPHFVVNHFTLANVYIAMEEFEKAMHWYESTLKLQPEFAPAKDRLRTIQCYLLTKRERRQP
uniref:Tetratricopeptide repeat domain 17 n=1 Tax=Xiphophorus couchianus TaxID=32473 RepID=A0A3B5MG38_9TELE